MNAQVIISGKITDSKNKVIPGTSITIKNSYDGATSDSAGNYTFSTDAEGEQTLETSATGYKPFQQKINLNSNSQVVNISLKELLVTWLGFIIGRCQFCWCSLACLHLLPDA